MEKERLIWIDLLNIVSCAGVLLLHCTNEEVHHFSGMPSANWFIGLTTHSFFLWPVNVFFMISGFTLIRPSLLGNNIKMKGMKNFYSRRLKRLGIPLLVWNMLYMVKYLVTSYHQGEEIETIQELIEKFVLFDYNGFMWFFVPLIIIYLSFPFLAVFILNSNRSMLRLFLVMGLVLGCIPPLESSFTVKEGLSSIYLMGTRFLYFIVLGYYFGNFEITPKTRRKIYICSIVSMIVMFFGTVVLTLYIPEHSRYFINYTNIPCIIAAIGVFTFFRYHDWNKLLGQIRLVKSHLAYLSSLSLGIYLIQGAWFSVLNIFHVCEEHILLRFVVMYALCVVSVWAMKRMPWVRQLV